MLQHSHDSLCIPLALNLHEGKTGLKLMHSLERALQSHSIALWGKNYIQAVSTHSADALPVRAVNTGAAQQQAQKAGVTEPNPLIAWERSLLLPVSARVL